MSNLVKDIFASKKYPNFITSNNIFKNKKSLDKVFPKIGLDNCEKPIEIDNKNEAILAATQLINSINGEVFNKIAHLNKYKDYYSDNVKYNFCCKLLRDVQSLLQDKGAALKCISQNSDKIILKIPSNIEDANNNIIFKKDESLFKVYNKINKLLIDNDFIEMESIESFSTFKSFSTQNVPKLKYKIIFSSTGEDGIWDIATMSMRGIASCQTWGSSNSSSIVGSMVDPFTGIIYLSSNDDTEYGSKMIRRSIVRFAIDKQSEKPFLLMEKMYPYSDQAIVKEFIDFLKEKTENKLDVHFSEYGGCSTSYYVPMSADISKLSQYDLPYRDSNISYSEITDNTKKDERLLKLNEIMSSAIISSVQGVKLHTIPKSNHNIIKMLRGDEYNLDYSYCFKNNIKSLVDDYIVSTKIVNTEDNMYNFYTSSLKDLLNKNIKEDLAKILDISIMNMPKKMSKGKTLDRSLAEYIATETEKKIKSSIETELNKVNINKLSKDNSKLQFLDYKRFLN